MREMESGDYMMGFFPSKNRANTGAIIKGENLVPGSEGAMIYFDCGDNLESPLSRIKAAGGEVIFNKTFLLVFWFQQALHKPKFCDLLNDSTLNVKGTKQKGEKHCFALLIPRESGFGQLS